MNFEIVATSFFIRELKWLAKRYPAIRKDIADLSAMLLEKPDIGTPLGQGCYKIRFPITGKNRGKSGGARVITFFKSADERIFLLSIYDKTEREALDSNELDFLLAQIGL